MFVSITELNVFSIVLFDTFLFSNRLCVAHPYKIPTSSCLGGENAANSIMPS